MEQLNRILSGTLLPFFLFFFALFFLFMLKGRPFWGISRLLSGLKEGEAAGMDPKKTVLMALAGTLGVGNIIGVADAVIKGGAGVLFWMALSSFAAAVIKYCEIVVSMNHRKFQRDRVSGGPMYYMFPRAAALLFCVLCLICAFSVGSAMQSYAAGAMCTTALGIPSVFAGILLAPAVALCIFKGQKRLFDLTVKLVPLMTGIYFVLCFSVILRHYQAFPHVIGRIFREAFNFKSAVSGTAATAFTALRFGVIRGLLSNEAGCGTAPMAHTASNCKNSPSQGALGVVEVAVDTLILCTVTGVTLLLVPESLALPSSQAIICALSSVFGRASGHLLTLSVLLFSFATMVCWSYYLEATAGFLFKKRWCMQLTRLIFCFFCFFGAVSSEGWIWQVADFAVAAMTLLNLFYLFVYRESVKDSTESYFRKKDGRKERSKKVAYPKKMPDD